LAISAFPAPSGSDFGTASGWPIPPPSLPVSGDPSLRPSACSTTAVGVNSFDNGADCDARRGADMLRPDGVLVSIVLGDCSAPGNPPGDLVLSTASLASIVADSRWGMLMPTDLVQSGARQFGSQLSPMPEVPSR